MHTAAMEYVKRWATDEPIRVLDIGSRDVNGTPRHLFPNADYVGIDKVPGPGVDIVDDATFPLQEWGTYHLVLCLEVLEHSHQWPAIVASALSHVIPDGRVVITCAGPGRKPHSAVDGGPTLYPGEQYGNINPHRLYVAMDRVGWFVEECYQAGEDVQATAVRYE